MNKEKTLFKVGDQVEIINYGHKVFNFTTDEKLLTKDISPELIGQKGIIINAYKTQKQDIYSLFGVNKTARYDNGQLKLIYRPEYK